MNIIEVDRILGNPRREKEKGEAMGALG